MATSVEASELSNMKVDESVAKAFDGAVTPEDIRAIIEQEAAKQNLVIPRDDKGRFMSTKPADEVKQDEPKTAAKADDKGDDKEGFKYEDTFQIGGKSYKFEGDSPADINRQVKAAIAAHENATKIPEVTTPTVDPKKAADEKAALHLAFQTGKITIDEYIEKSGAVEKFLEKKGIKVDELKETVEEKRTKKEENAWATATKDWLKADDNDWPGGEQNLKIMGYKLAELGLADNPSAESLQRAYAAMKEDKTVFPGEKSAEVAATPAAEQPKPKKKLDGSGLFNVRGGNSKDTPKATQADIPKIDDNDSPAAIIEKFKQAALAQGIHPDELVRGRA